MGIECLKMFLIYQEIFKVAVVFFILSCFGGGSYYKETAAISNRNKLHKNVPTFQKKFLESKKAVT